MYLCQTIEPHHDASSFHPNGFHRVEYRVELSSSGIPVWAIHFRGHPHHGNYYSAKLNRYIAADRYIKRTGRKALPWIASANHRRPVTKSQAMKLTGLTLGAAALDFLTEQLQHGVTGELQNYVKPAAKKPLKK